MMLTSVAELNGASGAGVRRMDRMEESGQRCDELPHFICTSIAPVIIFEFQGKCFLFD